MKILIVEDNQRIAESLKKGFEQENYTVDLALDGNIGLDMATTGNYDLIILDLMLPYKNGEEICIRLRKIGMTIPILILTAKDSNEDIIKLLNSGADEYLTKPFSFQVLLARVRALLRRPQNIDMSKKISLDDLEMDLNLYKVTRANNEIELTKKEYMLLEYLLENQEKILSKVQIQDKLWGYDEQVTDNTIEVFIKNLRNKIDKDYDKKLIKTVRGYGYKLSSPD